MSSTLAEQRRAAFLAWMQQEGTNSYRVAKISGVPYTTLKSYERGPTQSLRGSAEAQIARSHDTTVEAIFGTTLGEEAGQPEQNNIRAWRLHQGLSIEEVAEGAESTVEILTQLEEGLLPLTPKWLRRLEPVLGVKAGWILDYAPDAIPNDIVELWAKIPEDRQDQAIKVLETFKRVS